MDIFFNILKKGLLATMLVAFTLVATYTPQLPTSQVEEVEAGGGIAGGATEITQLLNNALLGTSVVQQTITAGSTAMNWIKENVLDGLGFAIAKRIVSGMIRSLINWVNSGFEGSPSFITDFRGFLLDIADQEIGRVISELGEVGSFICSPFRLDVQISVALQYQRGRETQTAPSCTLSGIVSNIEGFIQGTDFDGGLADWFTITNTPQTYTPYGAALSAQATARARLINAQGEEVTLLDFGDGFQSQELCQSVSGFTGSEDCSIVKPGRVIADQINNALDTGRQTLVEADEINELIAALLGQLANQALSGVAGLLGLSGGSGFSGYSGFDGGTSYLDDLVNESNTVVLNNSGGNGEGLTVIEESLDTQEEYRGSMLVIINRFIDFATASTTSQDDFVRAVQTISQINDNIILATDNINVLRDMIDRYQIGTDQERVDILINYTTLQLPNQNTITNQLAAWDIIAEELGIIDPNDPTQEDLETDTITDPIIIDRSVLEELLESMPEETASTT